MGQASYLSWLSPLQSIRVSALALTLIPCKADRNRRGTCSALLVLVCLCFMERRRPSLAASFIFLISGLATTFTPSPRCLLHGTACRPDEKPNSRPAPRNRSRSAAALP